MHPGPSRGVLCGSGRSHSREELYALSRAVCRDCHAKRLSYEPLRLRYIFPGCRSDRVVAGIRRRVRALQLAADRLLLGEGRCGEIIVFGFVSRIFLRFRAATAARKIGNSLSGKRSLRTLVSWIQLTLITFPPRLSCMEINVTCRYDPSRCREAFWRCNGKYIIISVRGS